VLPAWHWHWLLWHVLPPVQAKDAPQPPQFELSLVGSTQEVPHCIRPDAHAEAQERVLPEPAHSGVPPEHMVVQLRGAKAVAFGIRSIVGDRAAVSPTRGARRGGKGAVPGRVARHRSGHVRERRAIVAARAAVVHVARHTTRGTREGAGRAPTRVGSDRGLSRARFGSVVARIGRGTTLCRRLCRRSGVRILDSSVAVCCVVRLSVLGYNVSGNLGRHRTRFPVDHGGVEGSASAPVSGPSGLSDNPEQANTSGAQSEVKSTWQSLIATSPAIRRIRPSRQRGSFRRSKA
jgi:hypothetical protein